MERLSTDSPLSPVIAACANSGGPLDGALRDTNSSTEEKPNTHRVLAHSAEPRVNPRIPSIAFLGLEMFFTSSANYSGAALSSARKQLQTVLCLPFDFVRMNYSVAVRVGLIERSMLASASFGRWLNTLEGIALGPLARRR